MNITKVNLVLPFNKEKVNSIAWKDKQAQQYIQITITDNGNSNQKDTLLN